MLEWWWKSHASLGLFIFPLRIATENKVPNAEETEACHTFDFICPFSSQALGIQYITSYMIQAHCYAIFCLN